MPNRLLKSYEEPADHKVVSDIIRRHSVNPVDVREHVLANRDLSWASSILDLGCGYGFMAERLASLVAEDAVLLGVDLCGTNRGEFMRRVRMQGRKASFVSMLLHDRLPWETGAFDLIVSSYSLYFFPELVSEIARVLHRRGLFLTLTHTMHSQRDLLACFGVSEDDSPLVRLVSRFSVENAAEVLSSCFGQVEQVDYFNALRFDVDDVDDLAVYLRFKLLLAGEVSVPSAILSTTDLAQLLNTRGPVEIRKDDAAFWCREPHHSGNDRHNGGDVEEE
ncbi:MAG: methyltransferase domain-containing protein [Actinobacteria bacterium]|nr:methyltransferase domain-containing protein [Actinomycetota bacterium]